MQSPIETIQQRLGNREDSEHVQAVIRLLLTVVTIAIMYVLDPPETARRAYFLIGRLVILSSFVIAVGILISIVVAPAVSVGRRCIGMTHDTLILSVALYLGQATLAPYAALYLIVSVANGFRFGTRYLYATTAMSLFGFTVVYQTSAFWRDQTTMSIIVFVMLAVVPIYVGQLLKSLHLARDQLRLQATVDPLTKLLNRAELERRIEASLKLAPRDHVLLFCDLDRFKAVNDIAGHAAGDKLLVDIGRIIRTEASVEPEALCGRPGGDEFCVFLPACDVDRARRIACRIRDGIAGYRLGWSRSYYSVSVSIGVAPSAAVSDMKSLFRLADAACYAAKNAGRNEIHVIDAHQIPDVVDTASVRRLYLETGGDHTSDIESAGHGQRGGR